MSERKASMGDKVYRGDVVKFIRNNISLGTFMKRTVKTANEACWDLCDKLNYVPTIEDKNEPHWIPVTERLPYAEYGESDNVLATCGYRDVEDGSIRWIKTLYFNGGNWCYPTGETYLEKVYAWMPLPDPYKGVTT